MLMLIRLLFVMEFCSLNIRCVFSAVVGPLGQWLLGGNKGLERCSASAVCQLY